MDEATRCELVSWERFRVPARELALAIHYAPFRPELIVAIGRGGYLPARLLSDYLDVYDLTAFRIEHYRGAHRARAARVRYPLTADITGRRVLLVDDVSDSGDTFEVAVRHLRTLGEPAALRTAVLHHKTVCAYTPDFHAALVTEWHWIIYPWAVLEDLRGFLHDMDPPPASVAEFARRPRERHGIEPDPQAVSDAFNLPAP